MRCPYCGKSKDRVMDTRISQAGKAVRRRRECLNCKKRFTTYEYVEEHPLMVRKKDGRREPFNRSKLMAGILKACEKRPISMKRLEKLVDSIQQELLKDFPTEVKSKQIGELVMRKLHSLDQVAYVRFASVYRQFRDIKQFMKELKFLLR